MADVLDVANYFLAVSEKGMSLEKLNLLCCYAQAYCLGLLGRPLFEDEIYAGDEGPVIPTLVEHFTEGDKTKHG